MCANTICTNQRPNLVIHRKPKNMVEAIQGNDNSNALEALATGIASIVHNVATK